MNLCRNICPNKHEEEQLTDEVQSGQRNWDCGFWAAVQAGKSEAEDFMAKEVHQKKTD